MSPLGETGQNREGGLSVFSFITCESIIIFIKKYMMLRSERGASFHVFPHLASTNIVSTKLMILKGSKTEIVWR